MTRPLPPAPTAIPLSSLLPPSSAAGPSKHQYFPSPTAAIFGPLPVSSPFHLAISFLELQDIPEYRDVSLVEEGHLDSSRRKEKGRANDRVLIITTSKDSIYRLLEEEDEIWLRERGGAYEVVEKLKRVDVRYCPTSQHLLLLLTLLNSAPDTDSSIAPNLVQIPGLVILWDTVNHLMEDVDEEVENVPPQNPVPVEDDPLNAAYEEQSTKRDDDRPLKRFRPDTTISSYLDLIAAARSAVDHLQEVNSNDPRPQLIILEPNLSPDSILPIMLPNPETPATPSGTRTRRIPIIDGLRWMFDDDVMGFVKPENPPSSDSDELKYTLSMEYSKALDENGVDVGMTRKRAQPNPYLGAMRSFPGREGEEGPWTWEWS